MGEHISLGICVSRTGEHISQGICVPQVDKVLYKKESCRSWLKQFLFLFFFYNFFNRPFFLFFSTISGGKNPIVAGDSAGCRHILASLIIMVKLFGRKNKTQSTCTAVSIVFETLLWSAWDRLISLNNIIVAHTFWLGWRIDYFVFNSYDSSDVK